ncbi:MAG TPA: type I glutamate--ammonia ligase [Anaerolineae bacterium]|nr:type I glutamate--ammonia ligase [Anaerolineae bacterium]
MIPEITEKEILERVKADGVHFVSLQFTDVMGTVKNVTIPTERLEEALEKGIWFDGSSIEGFTRIYESDMFLVPDPATYRVFPWGSQEHRAARLICDVYTPKGEPFEGDPRHILKRAIATAEEMGYVYNTGPEIEFFLFKMNERPLITPVPHDVGGYFDFSPRDLASQVRQDIVLALSQMGMKVEADHHEVAMGQHEIDFEYADALTSADNCITFKYTVKAVAQRHGLYATFMPKPLFGVNGSGMHTHQSLFNPAGENVFYDPDDRYRLSRTAYNFIAGQMAHARALAAIVAPTVNSYKRLTPGYEAPVYICWAQINRAALIRIPSYSPGREQSTRLELRCPDPSCNPYLAFAAMLMAGLDGIKRDLTPPPPVEEDVYHFDDAKLRELAIDTLPATLGEALEELEGDRLLRETLGEHAYEAFTRAKRAEWDEYRIQVTGWELDRYLQVL